MYIVAFGASTSKNSINKHLASYAAGLVAGANVDVIDLNDYSTPLFSVDLEEQVGQPQAAKAFLDKIGIADALVVSFAEHNGSYAAAYKNLFDWCSRINPKVWQEKPIVMLATSPGARGATNVLNQAVTSAPHFAGNVKKSMSVPSFYENFDLESNKVSNPEIEAGLLETMKSLS